MYCDVHDGLRPEARCHLLAGHAPPCEEDPVSAAERRVRCGMGVSIAHLEPWVGRPRRALDVAFTAGAIAAENAIATFPWRYRGIIEKTQADRGSPEVITDEEPSSPTEGRPKSWPVVTRSTSYAMPWGDVLRSEIESLSVARALADAARQRVQELLRCVDQILICGSQNPRVPGIADLLGGRFVNATAEVVLREATARLAGPDAARLGRARVVFSDVVVLAPMIATRHEGAWSPAMSPESGNPILEVVVVSRFAGVVPEAVPSDQP